jgi:multidrug resistance protein, MATE family
VHHLNEQWDAAVAEGKIHTTWQREAKTIAGYSRSMIITCLLQYSINVASIFAVGHIGNVELGAVSCKCVPCLALTYCTIHACTCADLLANRFPFL